MECVNRTRQDVRVDEIPTLLVEVIQDFKHSLLVAFAHELLPCVAEVHGAETQRGDFDARGGREDTVPAEKGGGWRWNGWHGDE